MPIYPLPVYSEEQELAAIEKLKPPKTVVVRYGYLKSVGEFPYDGDQVIGCGTKLVVRSPRGIEMAEMLTTTCSNSGCGKSVSRKQMLDYIDNSGGKQYPFTTEGKIVRIASVEDLNEHSRIEADKTRLVKAAKEAIKSLDLPMKLVDAEELLSRDKVVYYFTSEARIDFRELVRILAGEVHMRIEMRQVGARDEARIVADYEKCGMHCCCKQFLKVLKPVSMRSAKVQKATLDPSKISGRCGRLMCCLRYEDETYEDLRKRLPNRKSRVQTPDGVGTVVNSQILTQLVLVELDGTYKRFAFPVENIEVLTGDAAKPPPPRPEREERGPRDRGPRPAPGGPAGPGAPGGPGGPGGPRGERPQGPRNDRPARGPSGAGPTRPQPGRPLRDEQVENREGGRADDLPPTEGVEELEITDAQMPEGGPNVEGDDMGPEDGGDQPQVREQGPGGQPGGPGAPGGPGDGQRRKRRRRRRRRGGGGGPGGQGGPGGPDGRGPNPGGDGSGGGGGGGSPPPPPQA